MSKHYIRVNEKEQVTYGFSEDFEQPLETDICINEDGSRQFELLGELNPSILDERDCHRFIYEKIETPHEEPVSEDATDEAIVDTSGVTLDEGTLTDIDVSVIANGYKTSIDVTYNLRYATQEELDKEYEELPKPEPIPSMDEQLTELQLALCDQYETNERLQNEVTNNEMALCELYMMIGGGE